MTRGDGTGRRSTQGSKVKQPPSSRAVKKQTGGVEAVEGQGAHSSQSSNLVLVEQVNDDHKVVTQMIPASKTRPMKKEIRAYETKNNYQNSQLHNRLMLSSERVSQTPGSKVASYNKISLLKNTTISSTDRLSSTNLGSSNILQSSSRQNSSIRKSQQYPPQRSIM